MKGTEIQKTILTCASILFFMLTSEKTDYLVKKKFHINEYDEILFKTVDNNTVSKNEFKQFVIKKKNCNPCEHNIKHYKKESEIFNKIQGFKITYCEKFYNIKVKFINDDTISVTDVDEDNKETRNMQLNYKTHASDDILPTSISLKEVFLMFDHEKEIQKSNSMTNNISKKIIILPFDTKVQNAAFVFFNKKIFSENENFRISFFDENPINEDVKRAEQIMEHHLKLIFEEKIENFISKNNISNLEFKKKFKIFCLKYPHEKIINLLQHIEDKQLCEEKDVLNDFELFLNEFKDIETELKSRSKFMRIDDSNNSEKNYKYTHCSSLDFISDNQEYDNFFSEEANLKIVKDGKKKHLEKRVEFKRKMLGSMISKSLPCYEIITEEDNQKTQVKNFTRKETEMIQDVKILRFFGVSGYTILLKYHCMNFENDKLPDYDFRDEYVYMSLFTKKQIHCSGNGVSIDETNRIFYVLGENLTYEQVLRDQRGSCLDNVKLFIDKSDGTKKYFYKGRSKNSFRFTFDIKNSGKESIEYKDGIITYIKTVFDNADIYTNIDLAKKVFILNIKNVDYIRKSFSLNTQDEELELIILHILLSIDKIEVILKNNFWNRLLRSSQIIKIDSFVKQIREILCRGRSEAIQISPRVSYFFFNIFDYKPTTSSKNILLMLFKYSIMRELKKDSIIEALSKKISTNSSYLKSFSKYFCKIFLSAIIRNDLV